MKIIIAFALLVMLSGCDLVNNLAPCSDGHCRPPTESIVEIRTLGVTIAPVTRPFPSIVETGIYTRESDGEQFIFSNELELFFSPSMTIDTVADPDSFANDWADHPYAFSFSAEVNGTFEMIKPIVPSNSFLFPDSLFSPLLVTDDPSELIVFGNHILEAPSMFPLRATHIEIWFRSEREDIFSLMQRTELENLIAWRNLLKPSI